MEFKHKSVLLEETIDGVIGQNTWNSLYSQTAK